MTQEVSKRYVTTDFLRLASQFGTLARGSEHAVRLDLCCLLISRIVEPELNQFAAVQRLDELAAAVRAEGGQSTSAQVEALRRVLFEQNSFRGDSDTYYDPSNCCLHTALETGRGMPITLAVLMIEVARRVGLELRGVGAPFHFLVKYTDSEGGAEHFLDPFHGGREIDREALAERLRATSRGEGPSPDALLSAVGKRQILERILNNLKGALIRRGDYEPAIAATDFRLALFPWSLEDRRDRGLLCFATGQYIEALDDLQQYQEHRSDAPDRERVAEYIQLVQTRIAEGA